MDLKNKINYLLIAGLLIQLTTLKAQKFENYKQALKGETISIEMVAVTGGFFLMGTKKHLA